ncbi:ThuA domain-containing protein [Portibacter marinus]|uniref:ThuA domain-containing protein n=1 Tax=Portibacter marinus TaxID=2898660 RepID=UPI001F3D80EB|nr:ThuA domain-containing protein [Portibacter marinus]
MQISLTRPFWSLLVVFYLMGCGSSEQSSAVDQEEEVKEWLVFDGSESNDKEIVLVSGDEEYRSEEALTQLAKILSEHHGFKCTVLYAQDPERPGYVDANYTRNIPGLEALSTADLMVIFTRFRALPDDQMKYIDDYLKAGKPVVGLRTATHAFNFAKDTMTRYPHYSNYYSGGEMGWTDGFGRLVLGEKWVNHHGHHKHQSTRGIIAPDAEGHPVANGLESGEIWGSTDVYGVRLPLPGDSKPIVLGQVVNREGAYDEEDIFFGMKDTDSEVAEVNDKGIRVNDTLMPIAWTRTYEIPGGQRGRAFTSTIGSSSDMLNEGVRRLIVNGVFWAMGLDVPDEANVALVGNYDPSAYGFKDENYWPERGLKIAELKE